MAQINQITKVRLPGGEEVAIVDWSHRVLYSSCDLLSGFTDVEIYTFTYVESDQVASSANIATPRLATLMDTNIAQPGQMDATEECLIYGISTELYQLTQTVSTGALNEFGANGRPMVPAATMAHLHRRLILELEVSQKAFYQASIGWFTAGFGPAVAIGTPSVANNTTTYISDAVNGLPGHMARHNAQIPVHIGGTEKFKVILHNPTGAAVNIPGFGAGEGSDNGDTVANYVIARFNFDCLHKRPTA